MAFPTLSYSITDPVAGTPPIISTLSLTASGTPAVPSGIQAMNMVGKKVKAYDPTYGEGTFIYLKGVVNTLPGDLVIYDEYANTTVLTVAGSRGSVAVAVSANVASQYGWYQVEGAAVIAISGTIAAADPAYFTATPGVASHTVVAGDKVDGITFKTANSVPAAGYAVAQISWPTASGNG